MKFSIDVIKILTCDPDPRLEGIWYAVPAVRLLSEDKEGTIETMGVFPYAPGEDGEPSRIAANVRANLLRTALLKVGEK